MPIVPTQYAHLLDKLVSRGVAFACYFLPFSSKPMLVVEEGQPAEFTSFSELNGTEGFAFAPFTISEGTPLLLFQSKNIYSGFADGITIPKGEVVSTELNSDHSTSQIVYEDTFNQFMEQLHTGRFSKLVLSRKLIVPQINPSIGEVFLSTNEAYPSAFTYLVNAPKAGLWLGATPELLLKGNGGNFQTVALAGTMPVSSAGSEYIWNDKDREEQQMVVDYISDRLTSCGVSSIDRGVPITVRAGNVVHLKTTFKFSTDSVGVGNLVSTLHPTPAICGIPKEDAQRYIIETEKHNREYYTGFAGVISTTSETELYVNLRCMKVEQQQLSLFAGGGITAKSVGEREWMETTHKLQTLLTIIEAED